MKTATWDSCYDGQWKGIIVEEAFAHPAKYARTLIGRIYRHLLDSGYVRPGDVVGDPFGGVALGALDAMVGGLRWVGVELEPRFHKLGNDNLGLWRSRWGLSGAVLLNGDSRRFSEVLANAGAVVSSPPYVNSMESGDKSAHIDFTKCADGRKVKRTSAGTQGVRSESYGFTPGQLGALPAGSVDAVVSSPPYADSIKGEHGEKETAEESREKRQTPGGSLGQSQRNGGYGSEPGNLGNLPGDGFGAVVSSPPYEDSVNSQSHGIDWSKAGPATGNRRRGEGTKHEETLRAQMAYGSASGQLGAEAGETFWHAARVIVAQCYAVLRPGAVSVWVCKDYVKDKARVPFSDQWRRLCESAGFVPLEWIKASLVTEWDEHTLFSGTVTKKKERKSFFRRLAEKKGSPRIDHEDVLILRKPA